MIAGTLVATAPFLFTAAAAGLSHAISRGVLTERRRAATAVAALLTFAIAAAWLGPWPRHPGDATGRAGILIDAHSGMLLRITGLALGLWVFGCGVPESAKAHRTARTHPGRSIGADGRRPSGELCSTRWCAATSPGPLWAFAGGFLACVADAWWIALLAIECVAAGLAMQPAASVDGDPRASSSAVGAGRIPLATRRAQVFGTLLVLFGFAMLYALSGAAAFSEQSWSLARASDGPLPALPLALPLAVCGLVGVLVGLGMKLGCAPFHGVLPLPRSERLSDRRMMAHVLPLVAALAVVPRLAYGIELLAGTAAATLFAVLAVFGFLVPTCWACLSRDAAEQWRYLILAHWGCVFAAAFVSTGLSSESLRPRTAIKPSDRWPAPALLDMRRLSVRRWVFTPEPAVESGLVLAGGGAATVDDGPPVRGVVAADDPAPAAVANLGLLNLVLATALFVAFASGIRQHRTTPVFRGPSPLVVDAVAGSGRSDMWVAAAAVCAWATLAGLPPTLGAWPRGLLWTQLLTAARESDYQGIPAPAPLSLLVALAAAVHAAMVFFLAARWIFVIVFLPGARPFEPVGSFTFRVAVAAMSSLVVAGGVTLVAVGPILRLW